MKTSQKQAKPEEITVLKKHYQATSGLSFTEIAWDVMTDNIGWNSSDFVDEYGNNYTYRDYYELYRFLWEHETSVMEEPCKHDNQPSVCYECDEK